MLSTRMWAPLENFFMLLFISALMVPVLVVVANPLLLWTQARRSRPRESMQNQDSQLLSFSMVTVVRTPDQDLLAAKIDNVKQLQELGQWVLYHDGPASDELKDYLKRCHSSVQFFESNTRKGKNSVLNDAVERCSGDVVVFSDADSLLQPDCIVSLRKHFLNRGIGGVCGQRVIGEHSKNESGQTLYINLDSKIKFWESKLGQLTSNDGKLYAVRKSLLATVPDGVTDDLYNALIVLRQKHQLIFDQQLTASIRLPSRSLPHEVERRRRIVCRSLRGLWLQRRLFRWTEYGTLSLRLFINKVLRRFIPHALLLAILAANALIFSVSFTYLTILSVQLLFLAGLLSFSEGRWRESLPEPLYRLLFAIAYIAVGLYGTLLGSVDFLRGEKYVTWTPKKS